MVIRHSTSQVCKHPVIKQSSLEIEFIRDPQYNRRVKCDELNKQNKFLLYVLKLNAAIQVTTKQYLKMALFILFFSM